MLPATIAICRKLCSLQAKQKRCYDLNKRHPQKVRIEFFNLKSRAKQNRRGIFACLNISPSGGVDSLRTSPAIITAIHFAHLSYFKINIILL